MQMQMTMVVEVPNDDNDQDDSHPIRRRAHFLSLALSSFSCAPCGRCSAGGDNPGAHEHQPPALGGPESATHAQRQNDDDNRPEPDDHFEAAPQLLSDNSSIPLAAATAGPMRDPAFYLV